MMLAKHRRTTLSLALIAALTAAPHAADVGSPASRADIERLAKDLDSASRKIHTEVDDGTVARNVGRDIVYGLGTEVNGLFVTSEDGIVTLKGTVDSDETRELAIGRASRIAGVRRIINRLGTPGGEIPEDQAPIIAAAETDAGPIDFLTDSGLAGREIVVVNNDGVISIHGHINNEQARTLALIAAQRIEGARAVADYLHVIPGSRRNDDNLANIVRYRLGEIAGLRDAVREERRPTIERQSRDLVAVTVADGVATLTGRVHDASLKDAMLQRTAETTGIFAVQDRLTIDSAARATQRVRPPVKLINYGTLRR